MAAKNMKKKPAARAKKPNKPKAEGISHCIWCGVRKPTKDLNICQICFKQNEELLKRLDESRERSIKERLGELHNPTRDN
jgi:ribosomal protein S14